MTRVLAPPISDDPDDGDHRLSPRGKLVAAMCRTLEPSAQLELRRALAALLAPTRTAPQAHVAELGLLARLLETDGVSFGDVRVVPRTLYDERRRAGDPSAANAPRSRNLVDRYGCWTDACQAADGLKPDGRSDGPSVPWPVRATRRQPAPWTREQIIAAVRACADDLYRSPQRGEKPELTTSIYEEWVRRHRTRARETGRGTRLPHLPTVYLRLAPEHPPDTTRWELVLEAAFARNQPPVSAR